jgi:hypothetical protein
MNGIDFEEVAMVVFAFFVGLTIFVPVLAIAARFALKPVMETWIKLKQSQTTDEEKIMQDRRIALLEAEINSLQQMVHHQVEARDFDRALHVPSDPDKK